MQRFAFVILSQLWEDDSCDVRIGIDKSSRGTRYLHSCQLAVPAGVGPYIPCSVHFPRRASQRFDRRARHSARSRAPAWTQALGSIPVLANSDLMLAEND